MLCIHHFQPLESRPLCGFSSSGARPAESRPAVQLTGRTAAACLQCAACRRCEGVACTGEAAEMLLRTALLLLCLAAQLTASLAPALSTG